LMPERHGADSISARLVSLVLRGGRSAYRVFLSIQINTNLILILILQCSGVKSLPLAKA
jgi:hypothetical protein